MKIEIEESGKRRKVFYFPLSRTVFRIAARFLSEKNRSRRKLLLLAQSVEILKAYRRKNGRFDLLETNSSDGDFMRITV